MTRGGYREGSGRKSSWNYSDTQLIRVPKIFAAQLLQIARRLDQGEQLENLAISEEIDLDSVTESYNQDKLIQIAQDIVADPTIAPQAEDKHLIQRALTIFIERLTQ